MAGATLKLKALVLPLGLDTLGVALALGIAGLPARARTRIALLFAAFEAAMPLIGVGLGTPLGHAVGGAADYIAATLVAALGAYMLLPRDNGGGERLLSMTRRGLYGALALGVSISIDELAIGFSAGLLRVPLPVLVIAIAAQALTVTQIGVRLGSRVGGRWQESAERIAAIALITLGVILLAMLSAY